MRTALGIARALVTTFALVTASAAFAADGGTWSVSKSSGDVWMGSGNVQQVSLKSDDVLKPGDTIRTGRNGRVLLTRGEESIMIAPNSVVGLPAEKKEGLSTTIVQKAGSILLEVEKKNVKHFEVETPYLAAVVKGTKFEVKVGAKGTSVGVISGQVEVSDFKTGQIAQVMAGQHATAFSHGNAGLSLGGAGTLQPIEQGKPRPSTVDRVPVPRNGLGATGKPTSASLSQPKQGVKHGVSAPRHGVTRISGVLGEVKLNVHKVTHGLARNPNAAVASRSADRNNGTVWGSGDPGTSSNNSGGNGNNNGSNGNNSGGVNNAVASTGNSVSSAVAAVVGSSVGNGNGNNGNGNGNGGGNGSNAGGNGNGNGNGKNANAGGGNGNGNNGNGNGNGGGNGSNAGGNGNGNGNGHALGRNK